MQSYRITRTLPISLRKPNANTLNILARPLSTTQSNNMSFVRCYPRAVYGSADTSFAPIFRFLDEIDSYAREVQGQSSGRRSHRQQVRSFNPRFDVRETETAYVLNGELPGITRENIEIEFTDPQTLAIRGRVERSSTAGTPPTEAAATEASEEQKLQQHAAQDDAASTTSNSHHATVEDDLDVEFVEAPRSETEEAEAPAAEKTVAKEQAPQQQQQPQQKVERPSEKYWVAERGVGRFARTFSLPQRIEQDGVSASLSNGVLTVVVPKAKKYESRRIDIN